MARLTDPIAPAGTGSSLTGVPVSDDRSAAAALRDGLAGKQVCPFGFTKCGHGQFAGPLSPLHDGRYRGHEAGHQGTDRAAACAADTQPRCPWNALCDASALVNKGQVTARSVVWSDDAPVVAVTPHTSKGSVGNSASAIAVASRWRRLPGIARIAIALRSRQVTPIHCWSARAGGSIDRQAPAASAEEAPATDPYSLTAGRRLVGWRGQHRFFRMRSDSVQRRRAGRRKFVAGLMDASYPPWSWPRPCKSPRLPRHRKAIRFARSSSR